MIGKLFVDHVIGDMIMVTTEERRKIGRLSRAAGQRFEVLVRRDLEEKGWIVDKWTNNLEFVDSGSISDFIFRCKDCGRIFSFLADYNGNNYGDSIRDEERTILQIKEHSKDHTVEKIAEGPECNKFGKIIPAKPKMRFNPKTKSMSVVNMSSGFPDFIAISNGVWIGEPKSDSFMHVIPGTRGKTSGHDIIGVESKMTGDLDKEEKEKCRWYLDNNVFSKILIASKTKVKNKIVVVYTDFEEKYSGVITTK